MYKKILSITILGILLMILIPGVIAVASWTRGTTGLSHYYSFDSDNNTKIFDYKQVVNGTITGGQNYTLGLINNASIWNQSNYAVFTGLNITNTSLISVSYWLKNEVPSATNWAIICIGDSASANRLMQWRELDSRYDWTMWGSGNFINIALASINTSKWTHFVYIQNGTNGVLYIDAAYAGTAALTYSAVTHNLYLANYPTGQNIGRFYIDELGVWDNVALNTSDIAYLYNNGTPNVQQQPPFNSPISAPSWVIPTPTSGGANNTQVVLNASCAAGLNYFMYFDNSTNASTMVLNNASTGNYTTNVSVQGTYSYKATCYNATSGLSSDNATARTWIYDTTYPSITINANNEWNAQNFTQTNAYDNVLQVNLSFADNHILYGYQINVTKGGTTYWNETNESITGTLFNLSKNVSITSWPVGVYNVELLVSDSHTAEAIGDYIVDKKKSDLSFVTQTGNKISISTDESSIVNSVKKFDRYDFSFSFDDRQKKDRFFNVKSNKCDLTYIQDSPYKGHFVSFCGKDGNWLDFEGVAGQVIVNKVSNKHYRVYFSNLTPDVVFNSIGGLNVLNVNYTFYRGNYTFNNPQALALDFTTLYLNVTTDPRISNISSNLYYNGTLLTSLNASNSSSWFYFEKTFQTPNVTALMNFSWNISVSQGIGPSYNWSFNSTQQVYTFGIDNCSIGTNKTLVLRYYNESTPSVSLNESLEADFEVWSQNKSVLYEFSGTYASAINHSFCIFPSNANLSMDAYFKYVNAQSGFTHRYFLVNQSIGNVTQYLNLYNFDNATGVSSLKITTRYVSDYNYYKNVITTLQRFYVGEGVWRNVQQDESGDYGLMHFDIIEKKEDYRLIFFDRSTETTLKTTQSMKFVCTDYLCDLTYLLSPNMTSSSAEEINFTLTMNGTTKQINLTWFDNSGITQSVRLFVFQNTITGTNSVCDTTQVGNAGTFTCNASLYNGPVFISLRQNSGLIYGDYLELSGGKLGDFLPSGEGAIWAFLIMVVCLCFGLFSPVGSIITGIVGLIIIYMLGIFTALTMTGVIIAVVIGVEIGLKIRS